MDKKQLSDFRKRVTQYIDNRRLREAINEIKDTAHKVMAWEVEDKVKLAEQNYELMLQYLTQGAIDPARDDVYSSLVCDLYTLLDSLICYIESVDSPTLYYNTVRYNKLNRLTGVGELLQRYKRLAEKNSIFSIVTEAPGSTDKKAVRKQLETVQNELFSYIWTTPLLTSDDATEISNTLTDDLCASELKQHIISALTLGLMQQHDNRKLELLMEAYMRLTDIKVTSAALVGMLLALWKYSNRPLSRRLNDRLAAVKEMPEWTSDLRTTFIELIRARDTERINKKMREEVIPNMEKLRPNMMDKINDGSLNPDDAAAMQENPEWQELLEKSGVADQLKELTEIQMEGGDVMMSTFCHLKQFSFFNDIANWFLPFTTEHSEVMPIVGELDVIADMMDKSSMLCDSDKYSFMFALKSVPQMQKDMMINQLKGQRDMIYEAMSANLDNDVHPEARRIAVNSYIQNIYRFFKLFSRRSEFLDPFDTGVNLISVPALMEAFSDTEMLQVVAEFYFKLKYMRDALDVFNHLEELTPGDAPRYQKMGYCCERLCQYDKAIDFYQRAELLAPDSAWSLRRLAYCYHAINDNASALHYYQLLSEMQPDDLKSTMLYGQALVENGRYDEAIKQFYKVEFLDEHSTKIWRPLAWTLFLTSNFAGAQKYYQKIILDKPTANDYLNMGHVALAMGNIRDAVNNYALSIQKSHGDKEWFMRSLGNDREALKKAGVDLSIVPLIVDAALYQLQ